MGGPQTSTATLEVSGSAGEETLNRAGPPGSRQTGSGDIELWDISQEVTTRGFHLGKPTLLQLPSPSEARPPVLAVRVTAEQCHGQWSAVAPASRTPGPDDPLAQGWMPTEAT